MSDDEWVKEEPDCHACCDSGVVPRDRDERPALESEPWTWTHFVNCPSCRPTPEQVEAGIVAAEARRVEWERAVTAGEITPDEAPF